MTDQTINVKIELIETSQAIEREATNTYTKGALYCVFTNGVVEKYPLANVWRITEDYGPVRAQYGSA